MKGKSRSLTEQGSSQFMMYFKMVSLGVVTFNSPNCFVLSPDADFWSFVLLKPISERGVLFLKFVAHELEIV